jgi:hypothetical protein
VDVVRCVKLENNYCDGYDSVLVMHLMCVLFKLGVIHNVIAPVNYDIGAHKMTVFAADYLRGNPHIFMDPKSRRSRDYDFY